MAGVVGGGPQVSASGWAPEYRRKLPLTMAVWGLSTQETEKPCISRRFTKLHNQHPINLTCHPPQHTLGGWR